jgi:hypothetical protein
MRRYVVAAVVVVVAAAAACSLVIDTKCFEGECLGPVQDAAPDVAADVQDARVAPDAPADANDVCLAFTDDPCRLLTRNNGGCYCGTSTSPGFDHSSANQDCIYRCNTGGPQIVTDSVKFCPSGCRIANIPYPDYCDGSPPCEGDAAECYATCTQ